MTLLDRAVQQLNEDDDPGGLLPDVHRHRRPGWRVKTANPLGSFADDAAKVIAVGELTGSFRSYKTGVINVLVADRGETSYTVVTVDDAAEDAVEETIEPGAPNAAVLLQAVAELRRWLDVTQDALCEYVGISRSTVMLWKRNPAVHPRHPRIPVLLGLWAAVAGAVEELGQDETTRLVYGPGRFQASGAVPVEALTEVLLDAADEASLRALEQTEYDPETATPMTVDEIEDGERQLHEALTQPLEGRDG